MTSNATFGSTTTASTVAKALSQYIKGKTVLITGVSPTSIGADTAYAIASGHPTKLILASRTKENIDAVAREIRKRNLSVVVQPLILDLSSQRSVRDAAAEVNRSITQLDLLIANAGVMAIPKRTLSEDNIELQFATNHIGHFLFTNLILEKMRVAAKASTVQGAVRLVVLSSNGHRFSPVRFNDYNFEGKPIPEEEEPCIEAMTNRGLDAPVFDSDHYQKFVAYGQSKTANILFALYVRSRLLKEGIQAVSVHPGSIVTGLIRHLSDLTIVNTVSQNAVKPNGTIGVGGFKTTDEGAATTLVAALDPKLGALEGAEGIYLSDCQIAEVQSHATSVASAERLWELSETLVNQRFTL